MQDASNRSYGLKIRMWIEGDDAHDNDDGGRGGNDGDRQTDSLVDSMRKSSPTVHECFLGVSFDGK